MTNLSRGAGGHGARSTITGTISNGVTWYEDVAITDENGNQVTGIDTDEFQLQIRENRDSTAIKTFSTTDGAGFGSATDTLTINEGASTTTLEIRISQADIDSLCGDYFIDLVSKAAADDRLIHWGHGMVSFTEDPVEF